MAGRQEKQPWYKDGLRFKCTQCGDCCTGAPGYVWFTKDEGQAMADLLEVDVETFYRKYARKIGIRYSLKEYANGDCIFFRQSRAKLQRLQRPSPSMQNLAVLGLQPEI